jgi:hypothetical protein
MIHLDEIAGGLSWRMSEKASRSLMVATFLLGAGVALPLSGGAAQRTDLSSEQIVERMLSRNEARTIALKHYQSLRHYEVEYRGFTALAAKMEVEAVFDASTGKRLRIVSQSGSKFLCDKVLKRAVESENEASRDKASTAMTPANYKFNLVGSESVAGHPSYILDVEPLKESKFLYRGKIWVDAEDFAVAKIEVKPSKNPSFWIAGAEIHNTSAKFGDFWLPQHLRSETRVRIGGTAILTIDYGTYKVQPEGAQTASVF